MKNWLSNRQKDPLLQVSTPYNQMLKRQHEALLISLIIALAVAGFYTYFYTKDQIAAQQQVSVVVAKQDLSAPHQLTADNLQTVMIAQKLLPDGTFLEKDKDQLIGKSLTQPLKAKQIILAHQIQSDLDPDSISAQFDEWFALSMDEDWFVAKFPDFKANDRVDLLVTNPRNGLDATTVLARDLKVISIGQAKNKRQIVVNSTEEEAKAILFARGLKLPMQILVHSAITPEPTPEEIIPSTEEAPTLEF